MTEFMGLHLYEEFPGTNITPFQVIMFLIVLIGGIIAVRIVSYLLKKTFLRMKVYEVLAEFIVRILRVILYLFVIGAAFAIVGINFGFALLSISVVFGFVLGFALGDTLASIAAGFMISITRPFKIGDYVEVSGVAGIITAVGISITEIDTPDNKHIVVPNKAVWGSNIVNYTKFGTRRVDMEVGIAYETDLDHALKTTIDICNANEKVLKDPAVQVAVKDYGDSAIMLVIRPWCNTVDYWDVFFELRKAIKEGYEKAGIAFPYPQVDVHMVEKK